MIEVLEGMEQIEGTKKVKIGLDELTHLIRESEKLAVIKRFVAKNEYISDSTMRIILDLPAKAGEGDEEY